MLSGLIRLASKYKKTGPQWTAASPVLSQLTDIRMWDNWLIKGQSSTGQTALALEWAWEFNQQGLPVWFVDLNDSLYGHRIADFDRSKLIVVRPNGPEDLISFLHCLSKEDRDPILIFDSGDFLRDRETFNLHRNFDNLIDQCFTRFHHPTIIATERLTKFPTQSERWKNKIILEQGKHWKLDGQICGHLVKLSCEDRSCTGFIDYRVGRFSKRYNEAAKEVRGGKAPSSIFEFKGQKIQGLQKFVMGCPPLEENEITSTDN